RRQQHRREHQPDRAVGRRLLGVLRARSHGHALHGESGVPLGVRRVAGQWRDDVVTLVEDRPGLDAEAPEPARRGTGILGWVTSTDHKVIGLAYMITGFVFFFIGGAMAELMRVQLAQPNESLISEDRYDQLFTMHGTIMLLLFVSPFALGLANYLVPLQIG